MVDQIMTVTDFKARCLDLLKLLGERRIGKVTVTRHGKPIAVITPAPTAAEEASAIFGSMRGSVVIREGVDLTEPVFEGEIEAESGLLHR